MVAIAGKQRKIFLSDPSDFDSNPWLLNVENGTVDLRTDELLAHQADNLLSKLVPFEYYADAECPRWERFLREIFAGDSQTIDFVQRAVGYTLTGLNKEHCIFVLFGNGHNGKSTFVNTIAQIVGDYGTATSPSTFVDRQAGGNTNDLAALRGARFVSAIETSQRAALAENFVKSVTGGDRIAARFLFHEFFEFEPTFKIWLATNHRPTIRGTDDGIWRRIRLIPFTQKFEELQDDKTLRDKLDAELPGILTWAVRGCLEWQRSGLTPSESVKSATASYRTDMDTFGDFLDERCIVEDGAKVSAKEIYGAYRAWADENGEKLVSQRWFGLRLGERGFAKKKSMGYPFYYGIRLPQ